MKLWFPTLEFFVLEDKIGLLIGKKGSHIKINQKLSAAKIVVGRWHNVSDSRQKIVRIYGAKESVEKASKLIAIWLANPTSQRDFVVDINHNDVSATVVDIAYEIESENDDDIEESQVEDQVVQIMIEKRCAKKSLTIVQGLSAEHDLKNIVKMAKKKFACNGTVKEHFLYGVIIELQGDQRAEICKLLIQQGLVVREQLKVHDF